MPRFSSPDSNIRSSVLLLYIFTHLPRHINLPLSFPHLLPIYYSISMISTILLLTNETDLNSEHRLETGLDYLASYSDIVVNCTSLSKHLSTLNEELRVE